MKKYIYVIKRELWHEHCACLYTTLHIINNYKVDHRVNYVIVMINKKKGDKVFENALVIKDIDYDKFIVK